jgi:hypothetical protein
MNGLLEQGASQQPPAATLAPEAQASPEQSKPGGILQGAQNQQEVDIFVANGLRIVHTPNVADGLIKAIVKSDVPAVAVADATLNVVHRLETGAKEAKMLLSKSTLAYGANFIMGEVIAVAEAAGLPKMSDDDKYRAYSLMVSKYLDDAINTGKISKEEMMSLGKQAGETEEGKKIIAAGIEQVGEQAQQLQRLWNPRFR